MHNSVALTGFSTHFALMAKSEQSSPHRNESTAHSRPVQDVARNLDVDPEAGLSSEEVRRRLRKHGPNKLKESKGPSIWELLVNQFKSIVLIILAVAGVIAFAFGKWPEGVAIVAVLVVNAGIGFFSEWKAIRSMEALRRIGEARARVRRDGKDTEIPEEDLVPGDVVILESGNIAAADMRLIEANNLRVNESALTGESVSVDKQLEPVDEEVPLAERTNMAFKGTSFVEGTGEGLVTATGMKTELGRISEMAEEAEDQETPLQKRLDDLGRRLAWITIGIAVVVGISGLIAGQETLLMIETAIALGVAAIPEGLPIVATIALARGMWLMARRAALIKELTAVETLGATRVIFTDKTGTLTENRMTLRRIVTPEDDLDLEEMDEEPRGLARRVMEIGVLCNNAALGEDEDHDQGDPTEIALLRGGQARGLTRDEILESKPEEREVSFDQEVMMMATFHKTEEGLEVAVKGAPHVVLDTCSSIAGNEERALDDDLREEWKQRATKLASEGLRVLAIADRKAETADEEPYQDLRFAGFVGLLDPAREEVKEPIAACQRAGIRVIMVTGDQPETAAAIGREVGLAHEEEPDVVHGKELEHPDKMSEDDRRRVLNAGIFARVSPEQKLRLVQIFQAGGEIAAMTGDGINDAPALKKAEIGVAMGKRGTDAAREVADMVLKDDAFASIVAAVHQGRVIFSNIRKSVMFMLCTNVAEIFAVAAASLAGATIPLRPLQILYLNVITDVFPALALGVGKGSPHVMDQPPRDAKERVLTRLHWKLIGGWSFVIGSCVLAALYIGLQQLGLEEDAAITVSFMTLGFSKLWFVFNLRDAGTTLWRNDIVRNPWIWGAIGACILLLAAAVYMPGLSTVLETSAIGLKPWLVILGMSLVPFLLGQGIRFYQRVARSSKKA